MIDRKLECKVLATLYDNLTDQYHDYKERTEKHITYLFPQVFSDSNNQAIFKILFQCVTKRLPTSYEFIEKSFPAVSWLDMITSDKFGSDPRSLLWAIRHLKELYYLRLSQDMALKISQAAQNNQVELIEKLAGTIPKVRKRVFDEGQQNGNHLRTAVEVINSSSEFIPFSSPRAEKLFGGWTRSDISSIGGKSGHNKTTFIAHDAKESLKRGTVDKIIYFSVDEPGEKIARRIIASECDISLSAMRSKQIKLSFDEIQKAIGAIFKNRFIIIDDCFDAERIQQAVLDIKPDRFIVDHIQELDYGKDGISDQKVTVASKLFKEAARLTNSNGTIVSQVRDKLIDERFEDKIPRPHDFLYASDLRRKSREQTVVYWEYKDKQDNESLLTHFDFIVWKSTYSDTGKIRFTINPDKATFVEQESRRTVQDQHTEDQVWRTIDKL
jgi:replicative DNA helicase